MNKPSACANIFVTQLKFGMVVLTKKQCYGITCCAFLYLACKKETNKNNNKTNKQTNKNKKQKQTHKTHTHTHTHNKINKTKNKKQKKHYDDLQNCLDIILTYPPCRFHTVFCNSQHWCHEAKEQKTQPRTYNFVSHSMETSILSQGTDFHHATTVLS